MKTLVLFFLVHSLYASENNQMINLSMKIKSKREMISSDLSMPLYQTAEISKKVADKNLFIELIPRPGKKQDEIKLGIKFFNQEHEHKNHILAKKEIVAKLNSESQVSFRGITFKVRPVYN